jgi:hypothetical protein
MVDPNGDGPGSPVTFSDINGGGGNFWDLPTGSATSTLTVPIGLYGVTDVWTMINDIESAESSGTRDINVTFNFGTTANGIGGTNVSDTVKLYNANAANLPSTVAYPTGQVRDALVCNVGCNQTSQVALAGEVYGGVTVVADNVWSQAYQLSCSLPTTVGQNNDCNPPSGQAYLDDQGFFFNSLGLGGGLTNLNTYLVSVQVKEIGQSGGGAALSAITVDQAPEPSTVLLFVAGLGVVGLGRLRKRA